MKKREVNFIFIFVILLFSLSLALAQGSGNDAALCNSLRADFVDDPSTSKTNIADIINQFPPEQQLDFYNNYKEQFAACMREYLKSPENQKEFAGRWSEKEGDNKFKISDDLKNKIWGELGEKQKKEHVRNLMLESFKKFGEVDQGKFEQAIPLDSISVNGELNWEGNKLISKNEQKKAWVDFDDVPIWTNQIKFEEDKLTLGFDTGNAKKSVILSQGSIDQSGFIRSPNGRIVGTPLHEGITNIAYENGNLKISYKDLQNTERTLELSKEEALKGLTDLNEVIGSDKLENLFTELDKPHVKEILNELNFDADFSLNNKNKLNVLYGAGEDEIIEIDFDGNGKLTSQTSNRGTLVSTSEKGDVNAVYRQFHSEGSEKSVFLFDHNGDIKASKNGRVALKDIGEIKTSRTDLIGFETELDFSLAGLSDLNPESGPINLEKQIADVIKNNLEEGQITTQLKKKLNDLVGSLETRVGSSRDLFRSLVDKTLENGFGDLDFTSDQKYAITSTLDNLETASIKAFDKLLSDPNQLNRLIAGSNTERVEVLGNVLKTTLNDESLRGFTPFVAGLAAERLGDPDRFRDLNNNIDTNKVIDELIQKAPEFIAEAYQKSEGSSGVELSNDQNSMLAGISEIVQEQRKGYESILPETFKSYENKVVLGRDKIDVVSSKFVEVDLYNPLTEFSVTSTKDNTNPKNSAVNLKSNGHLVATFNGKETWINTHIDPKTDYYSIDKIRNTVNSENEFADLAAYSSATGPQWRMTFPGSIANRRTGDVVVQNVPDLGYYHAFDMSLHSGDPNAVDIALDPEAKIRIKNYAAYGTNDPNLQRALSIGAQKGAQEARRRIPLIGFLFEGYGRRKGMDIAFQKFMEGSNERIGDSTNQFGKSISEGFDSTLKPIISNWGEDNYEQFATRTLDIYGSQLPKQTSDQIYTSTKAGQKEFNKIVTFIKNNPTPILEVSPNGISTYNGASLNDVDDRVMRTFFRSFATKDEWSLKPRYGE